MIATLVVLAAAPACGPLDLPTALSLAAARSDEVAIKHAEVLGAAADQAIAKAAGILPMSSLTVITGPVPEAHGSVVESTNSNRSLRGLGPFWRVDVNLVQPLVTWGQLSAAREAAQAGIAGRLLAMEDTVHQVQLRVLQLYWGIALARRLLALGAEVEDALRQIEQRIAKSLAAADGQVTQEDKFRIAVFRGDLSQRRSEAQKGLRLARAGLAATLALPERELQLKEEPLPTPDVQVPDRDQALREAGGNRPDLLALDKAIVALEAQAKASYAARLPQIFAAATFAYALAPNRDIQRNPWVRDDFNLLAGGLVIGLRQNLALPLLRAQTDKAEAELARVKRERDGLARLVGLQIEQALADLTAALEKHAAAQGAVSAGRSWFRTAGLNFGVGVTDARGLIEAYSGYIKTQLDSAQATFELVVAQGHLDQVMGKALATGEPRCVVP